ncbi:MAG: metallophosphoesterase [Planctomycetota bacterium]
MKKLAILSDTHDYLDRIRAALVLTQMHGAEGLLHLGDFVAPFAMKEIVKFNGPLYAVFGNNDGEKAGLKKIFPEIQDGPRVLELGGRKFGVAHSLEDMPADYRDFCDGIFYGHTHTEMLKPRTATQPLELNPGECCGWVTGRATCALLDMETMQAKILEIK